MLLKQIYDPFLSQYAYLIGCQKSGEALIIDPERDVDRYIDIANDNDLKITAAAETHIHADFLSGTRQFVERVDGVRGYLSNEGGDDWQYVWAQDHADVTLIGEGDSFKVGNVEIIAKHFPGHTPEHLCYLIIDHGGGADEPMAIVSGDFMFVGDVGRPDLLESAAGQAGSQELGASQLFRSIEKFVKLPEFLQVLPGHGAGSSCGKALGSIPFSTTGYEQRFNSAVRTAVDDGEEAFVDEILEGQPEPPMYFATMKKTNRDGADVFDALPQPPQLTPTDLAALCQNHGDDLVWVDTRIDREAFMQDHLRDALHAPLGPKFTEAVGSYLEAGAEIILVVEAEDQVGSCVRQLVRIGQDKVRGYLLADDVYSASELGDCRASTPTIHTSEMNSGDRILDVRSASEYEEGHVPGAIHVPYTRIVADRDQLPDLGALTVHCGSGVRAALATSALERLGYEVTYANGDFSDWQDQAEKVETGSQ